MSPRCSSKVKIVQPTAVKTKVFCTLLTCSGYGTWQWGTDSLSHIFLLRSAGFDCAERARRIGVGLPLSSIKKPASTADPAANGKKQDWTRSVPRLCPCSSISARLNLLYLACRRAASGRSPHHSTYVPAPAPAPWYPQVASCESERVRKRMTQKSETADSLVSLFSLVSIFGYFTGVFLCNEHEPKPYRHSSGMTPLQGKRKPGSFVAAFRVFSRQWPSAARPAPVRRT